MKKGYKRLLIFELILLLIFILSGFVSSILSGYIKVISLVVILVLFKLFFGFEKDRHRQWKNIIIEFTIYLLIFFLLYYLLGILIGFSRSANYFTINGIVNTLLPLVLVIILKEILRYMFLVKSEGSRLLLICSTVLMIVFDLSGLVTPTTFTTSYSFFVFIAVTVLPTISTNVLCSYVTYNSGYKPSIFYMLVMSLYAFIIPIVPNPNDYIYSIIFLLLPFIFLYKIYKFFEKYKGKDIDRDYQKHKFVSLIVPALIVIVFVYFTSGYFNYHAVAIASGSMSPNILKGDVVVIDKTIEHEKIDVGEVIAVRKGNIIVVHRLINKEFIDNKYYFYTKGDANDDADNYLITDEMVLGVVNLRIPYIGYPAVWLNNL